jgi:hypothetical protein
MRLAPGGDFDLSPNPPEASIINTTDGESDLTVRVEASEALSECRILGLGSASEPLIALTIPEECIRVDTERRTWTFTIPAEELQPLSNGIYRVCVTGRDMGGNYLWGLNEPKVRKTTAEGDYTYEIDPDEFPYRIPGGDWVISDLDSGGDPENRAPYETVDSLSVFQICPPLERVSEGITLGTNSWLGKDFDLHYDSDDGHRLIAGADEAYGGFGSALLFSRDTDHYADNLWSLTREMLWQDSADPFNTCTHEADDGFGKKVSLFGDHTLIIGTDYDHTQTCTRLSKAFLYTKNQQNWEFSRTFHPPDDEEDQPFYHLGGLAAHADYFMFGHPTKILTGLPLDQNGRVYVYDYAGTLLDRIDAGADMDASDCFGSSISLSADGSRAIVSAWGCDTDFDPVHGVFYDADHTGRAFVFKRDGNTWSREAILSDPNGSDGDSFGNLNGIDGEFAICGAARKHDSRGSALLFQFDGQNWTLMEEFPRQGDGIELTPGDFFGLSTHLFGQYAIIGCPGRTIDGVAEAGMAVIYRYDPAADRWDLVTTLAECDPKETALFGHQVQLGNGIAGIAAVGADGGNGHVYSYPLFETGSIDPDPGGQDRFRICFDTVADAHNCCEIDFSETVDITSVETITKPVHGETVSSLNRTASIQGMTAIMQTDEGTIRLSFQTVMPDGVPNPDHVLDRLYTLDFSDFHGSFPVSMNIRLEWDQPTLQGNDHCQLLASLDGATWIDAVQKGVADQTTWHVTTDPLDIDSLSFSLQMSDTDKRIQFVVGDGLVAPLEQGNQMTIFAPTKHTDDAFGRSIAVDGSYLVVGATDHDVGVHDNQGALYFYRRSGSQWDFLNKGLEPNGLPGDELGYSVALSGRYAIAGAWNGATPDSGHAGGYACIFVRNKDDRWSMCCRLDPAFASDADHFGYDVAISGDYAAVSSVVDESGYWTGYHTGWVSIYRRLNDENWIEVARLSSEDDQDWFGGDIALDGDLLAVGAKYGHTPAAENSGSVTLFKRQLDGSWTRIANVYSTELESSDGFDDVAVFGDNLIVGAAGDDDRGTNAGAAYVFYRENDSTWVQHAKLTDPQGENGDFMGSSVALYGNYAVVGAYGDDEPEFRTGSACVFKRNSADESWAFMEKLSAAEPGRLDYLGAESAICQDYVLLAARKRDSENNGVTIDDCGAVFVYQIEMQDEHLLTENRLLLNCRVFLSGFYRQTHEKMNTALFSLSLLPQESPYVQAPGRALSLENTIVDWLVLECRTSKLGQAVYSKSVLLSRDGDLIDPLTGSRDIPLYLPEGDYYLAIKHRNHLPVVSRNAVSLTKAQKTIYNILSPDNVLNPRSVCFIGETEMQMQTGQIQTLSLYGMCPGDMNQDRVINTMDYIQWYNASSAGESGYSCCDLNGDGLVDDQDYLLWRDQARRGTGLQ